MSSRHSSVKDNSSRILILRRFVFGMIVKLDRTEFHFNDEHFLNRHYFF